MSTKDWKELYWDFAYEDLQVAELLLSSNPRLCTYHIGQSMEKSLKAIMAKRVDLSNKVVNQTFVRDHNFAKLMQRICEIYGAEMNIEPEYLRKQLQACIPTISRTKFHTFNKVRYPRWDAKKKRAATWQFSQKDCQRMIQEIKALRNWLEALR